MTLVGGISMTLPAMSQPVTAEPAALPGIDLAQREQRANRSAERQARIDDLAKKADSALAKRAEEARKAAEKAKKGQKNQKTALDGVQLQAAGFRYATANLNLRTAPNPSAKVADVLDEGSKVDITGGKVGDFTQVLVKGAGYWVSSQYLSQTKPEPKPATSPDAKSSSGSDGSDSGSSDSNGSGSSGNAGSSGSGAACTSGSKVESGLVPNAIKVHRAVCQRFPQISSFGGVRPDSLPEHPSGRALDAMIANNATGWQIARWVRANASSLGVTQVIYDRKIWTTQRSSEGWRSMSDRGGVTANHEDHVHITVS
ncbi:MAG: SH3 domain-containing protein [Propionibacteriales bacterium]|nr:SH3 domain-containing protein [Propionibacteriales bacterium]